MGTNTQYACIGERLRKLRKKDGHTQRRIGDYLDVSQSQYAKVETGERKLKLTQLIKLADLYGCPIEHILYGEEYEDTLTRFSSNKYLSLEKVTRMNKIIQNLHEMIEIDKKNK